MPDPCQVLQDALPELSRAGAALSPEQDAHVAACPACARAVSGARALGERLGAWSAPDPAADLVARTLARIRLAEAMAPREPSQRLALLPGGAAPPPPPAPVQGTPEVLDRAHRRRSSVELLATWALPGPRPAVVEMPKQKLGLRLAIQAAAAAVLVVVCAGAGVAVSAAYPSFVEAWESQSVHRCQEKLARLGQALARYRREHPASEQDPSDPSSIRDALVRGGYARDEDFVCPATHSPLGAVSYNLSFAAPNAPGRTIVGYDHFRNHGTSINVLRADGRIENLDEDQLAKRLAAGD